MSSGILFHQSLAYLLKSLVRLSINKLNIKAPYQYPLCMESAGNRCYYRKMIKVNLAAFNMYEVSVYWSYSYQRFWTGIKSYHLNNEFVDIHNTVWSFYHLTHWGRVMHICVRKLTIIGSDNGLAHGWNQTIIWTNDGILLIGPLGTNFSASLLGIQTFSFNKLHLKTSSAKWRLFCLGLNELNHCGMIMQYGITVFGLYWYMCTANGLVLGSIKPLHEPMLTHWGRVRAYMRQKTNQNWFR